MTPFPHHPPTSRATMLAMRKYLAVVVLLSALGACGEYVEPGATPPRSSATMEPSPVATKSPSSPTSRGLAMRALFRATEVDVRVIEYRRDVPGERDGGRLDGALVKTCIGSDSTLSWSPWSLVDADGGNYPAANYMYGGWMTPQYPFAGERAYRAGDCVKGWIIFDVPPTARFLEVSYGNSSGDTATWTIE